MSKYLLLLPVLGLLFVAGCGSNPYADSDEAPAAMQAAAEDPAESAADHEVDKYCRVCYVDGGHKMSGYTPERLKTEHKGLNYVFCSDRCKEAFDANPAKYEVAEVPQPAQ